jgi:hypothetical protein
MLADRSIDAISLDLIRDDDGRRLVENLRSVAWNGIASAFSDGIRADGPFHERALWRGSLRGWIAARQDGERERTATLAVSWT